MPTLFDAITLGNLTLKNRIVMAPLTRCRADEGRVPNAMMAEYYSQRSSAGLILSEATSVTPMGVGYPDTPGIWSQAQVDGWKLVTDAVHKAGSRIFPATVACWPHFRSDLFKWRKTCSPKCSASGGPCQSGASNERL